MNWNEIGKIYERPWGHYETLLIGDGYQVKRITVKPGQRLSLQKHFKRGEHWVAVSGEPSAVVNEKVIKMKRGEHVDVPKEAVHRLFNDTEMEAAIIEVQFGDYLGEDDIVRLEDDYGRGKISSSEQ